MPPIRRSNNKTTVSHQALPYTTGSSRTRRRNKPAEQAEPVVSPTQVDELATLRREFNHITVLPRAHFYKPVSNSLRIADPDPLILEYNNISPPPVPDLRVEQFTFICACNKVEMIHLKLFDRPVRTPLPEHNEAIGLAAEITAEILHLPRLLRFPDVEDLSSVNFAPGAFAGIHYALQGKPIRANADALAQNDAEIAFDSLLNGEYVAPHDVRMGGRGKIAEVPDGVAREQPPPVGRLILMLSHRDLKMCGVTEKQLTRAYSQPEYPIAVGQSWFHGGSQQFLERMAPYKTWYCFDAKKFDSNIDPWMVRVAIKIIRGQYYEGFDAKYDAYWNFIFDSLVEAPIYRDDGIRFQKYVGTTSGHSHNTLVESIITILLGYATLITMHPELTKEEIRQDAWMESLGDDNIMALKGKLLGHSVEDIATVMHTAFGIDWFGKKSFATTRLLDPHHGDFQGVQFLGKYWYLGDYPLETKVIKLPLPYRPAKETYLSLLFPEHGKLEPTNTYLRVLLKYMDAAGNRPMEAWLSGLLDWLETRRVEIPDNLPSHSRRIVSGVYRNVRGEMPRPKRINFLRWRDLVVLPREEYRRAWSGGRSRGY
uniref:Putative RdRp n=1 Tax=Podosphaera virus A TaxID=2592794 RepID=A0A7G3KHX5_9VIRU|nr:putative RdRp [Podosphaera virus A]